MQGQLAQYCHLYDISYLEHQSVLNVEQDLAGITVVANEHMKGITIFDPSHQTSVRRQRYYGVSLDMQTSLEAVGVHRKQCVYEAEELHDTLVLT